MISQPVSIGLFSFLLLLYKLPWWLRTTHVDASSNSVGQKSDMGLTHVILIKVSVSAGVVFAWQW